MPTGAPQNVTFSATSRNVSVLWLFINCTERNGLITKYTVMFQSESELIITSINETSFTASGLIPYTNYTFQVAGVNSNGTGPYSDVITILTSEEGNL